MKILIVCAILALTGCVDKNTAVAYAARSYPECTNFKPLAHRHDTPSQTEIRMTCGETTRSITIKCVFGWGIINDTTCHENN